MTIEDVPQSRASWSFYSRGSSSTSVSVSESNCSCISCGFSSGERSSRSSAVREGLNVTDFYRFGEILGEGTFSVVYLAESKTNFGGWAAIKVMEKSLLKRDGHDLTWLIDKEIAILSSLDHPHIVHLSEVYEEDNRVCFVMELAKGGEVFDRLVERGSFDEKVTSAVIVQLLYAVDYMHKQGIIHRDLKLENILYYDDEDDSKVMVADFGLSEWVWEVPEDPSICGTPGYMAPEVLSDKLVSTANDVWSIGVIAYILLSGYPPFFPNCSEDEDEDQALIDLIVKGKGKYEFHSHSWSNISESAKDFVRKLMCVDPERRLTCEEALDHPWLSGGQLKPEYEREEDFKLDEEQDDDEDEIETEGRNSVAQVGSEIWNLKRTGLFTMSALILTFVYVEFITRVFNLNGPIKHSFTNF